MLKLFKLPTHLHKPNDNSSLYYYYNASNNENVCLSSYLGRDCVPDFQQLYPHKMKAKDESNPVVRVASFNDYVCDKSEVETFKIITQIDYWHPHFVNT